MRRSEVTLIHIKSISKLCQLDALLVSDMGSRPLVFMHSPKIVCILVCAPCTRTGTPPIIQKTGITSEGGLWALVVDALGSLGCNDWQQRHHFGVCAGVHCAHVTLVGRSVLHPHAGHDSRELHLWHQRRPVHTSGRAHIRWGICMALTSAVSTLNSELR